MVSAPIDCVGVLLFDGFLGHRQDDGAEPCSRAARSINGQNGRAQFDAGQAFECHRTHDLFGWIDRAAAQRLKAGDSRIGYVSGLAVAIAPICSG
jgi:hypothetical protein